MTHWTLLSTYDPTNVSHFIFLLYLGLGFWRISLKSHLSESSRFYWCTCREKWSFFIQIIYFASSHTNCHVWRDGCNFPLVFLIKVNINCRFPWHCNLQMIEISALLRISRFREVQHCWQGTIFVLIISVWILKEFGS